MSFTSRGVNVAMMEKILASLGLVVCVALLVHMALGPRRRQAVDAAVARALQALRRTAWGLWHWRSTRETARREADDAIQRARQGRTQGQWDGNVYRPRSFKGPKKPH